MDTITIGAWIGHLGRGLAPRELQCILDVSQGFITQKIAKHIGISESGVETCIGDAILKLRVSRQAEAVAEAKHRQIIGPLCIDLTGLIAMHAVIDDHRPDAPRFGALQPPGSNVRKAEVLDLHAPEDHPI
ncbi:LuxR C-terminal-related transcriptional regulator [Pseudomonas asiatica]|uniref:LuxR C-terminal-related transcriptional regulator n=1 Tax=Pseudomonas asiatica TaxID=2219225 RepID=A0A9X4D4R2_9PSED|nr:LuxR C-terminal-related transcriptional regulator [Pseudomonas asiatica]MDD2109876.1 LuxR C-terminal-related transcriptional regulator [Pseudomonas asiatica]